MTKKTSLTVILIVLLSSCASGPEFKSLPSSDNAANFYVYRIANFAGGGIQPYVRINGERIYKIKSGTYSYVKLKPGTHELALHNAAALRSEAEEPYYNLRFTVKANDQVYFRWSANMHGLVANVPLNTYYAEFSPQYGFVEASTAQMEIAQTKLNEPETGNRTLEPVE